MIIKTYNGKQIEKGLLDKLSDAIQEQFLQLKVVKRNVNTANGRVKEALEASKEASQRASLFRVKKEDFMDLEFVDLNIVDAQMELARTLASSYEYQKILAKIINDLFELSVSNLIAIKNFEKESKLKSEETIDLEKKRYEELISLIHSLKERCSEQEEKIKELQKLMAN